MLKTEAGKYLIFMCSSRKIHIPGMEGLGLNPAFVSGNSTIFLKNMTVRVVRLETHPPHLVIFSNHLPWVSMDISKTTEKTYNVKIIYSLGPGK